jgi:hypothetical protein
MSGLSRFSAENSRVTESRRCPQSLSMEISGSAWSAASVRCPTCQEPLPTGAVDLDKGMAMCIRCARLFQLDDRIHERLLPPKPDSIEVETSPAVPGTYRSAETAPPLRIVYRWRHWSALALLAFGAMWFMMLSPFFFRDGELTIDASSLMTLLHVAAGAWVVYHGLAMTLNRTDITVAEGRLRVRHGPLPWRGNTELDARAIEQLFVRTRRNRRGGGRTSYVVAARIGDVAYDVVRTLRTEAEARFIERTIEKHLAIADDPRAHDHH